MNIVITGTSQGIGLDTAKIFLKYGHKVYGIDKQKSNIDSKNYIHIQQNILDELPDIDNVNILINNARIQKDDTKDSKDYEELEVNIKGTIEVTKKYGFQKDIKSIIFVTSASARTGSEFGNYVASKGAIVSYMKYVAQIISKYGATANSISPGGVITPLNDHILNDENLYKSVLNETLLNKWASSYEIAQFIYFLSVINKSMTGEDVFIDNGEQLKSNFIW